MELKVFGNKRTVFSTGKNIGELRGIKVPRPALLSCQQLAKLTLRLSVTANSEASDIQLSYLMFLDNFTETRIAL